MKIFNQSKVEPLQSAIFNGLNLDILRDDLIHPIVSGNKWRKLKYIVQHIQNNGIEHVVTFGGAYSNHLVAVAFVCNYLGIKSSAFIRGDEQRTQNHYEKICLENDMQLLPVSRAEYRNKELLFKTYYGQMENCMMIDEGGNHELALLGCKEILDELDKVYNYIILSLGTGTTMEGLVKGIISKNISTKIIGISALKNNFELDKRLEKYNPNSWAIFHDYHRGKYGKIDEELVQYIQKFYLETSIKLDTIYTGKMLMAVEDLFEKKYFKPTDKILLVHTGGLLAFPQ